MRGRLVNEETFRGTYWRGMRRDAAELGTAPQKLSGLNTNTCWSFPGFIEFQCIRGNLLCRIAHFLRESRHSLARRALWRWVDRVSGSEQFAREKFAVFVLVEPRALDVEQLEACEVCERERVDGELRNRPTGPSGGLVVEDMNGTVSDLQEVYVARD